MDLDNGVDEVIHVKDIVQKPSDLALILAIGSLEASRWLMENSRYLDPEGINKHLHKDAALQAAVLLITDFNFRVSKIMAKVSGDSASERVKATIKGFYGEVRNREDEKLAVMAVKAYSYMFSVLIGEASSVEELKDLAFRMPRGVSSAINISAIAALVFDSDDSLDKSIEVVLKELLSLKRQVVSHIAAMQADSKDSGEVKGIQVVAVSETEGMASHLENLIKAGKVKSKQEH